MPGGTRRLLAVLAHPDDESFLMGGTLARFAAEGVEIKLITATRGEAGRGDPDREQNGRRRERELRDAAGALSIASVEVLGYPDGRVSDVPRGELVSRVIVAIRAWRPDVVLTFGPDGISGHPDHVAVGEAAADAIVSVGGGIRLFQVVPSPATWQCCRRRSDAFDATGLTAVDISAHRVAKARAMQCHASQPQPFSGAPERVATQLIEREYFRLTWPPSAIAARAGFFDPIAAIAAAS